MPVPQTEDLWHSAVKGDTTSTEMELKHWCLRLPKNTGVSPILLATRAVSSAGNLPVFLYESLIPR
jgi:hypothetical protein